MDSAWSTNDWSYLTSVGWKTSDGNRLWQLKENIQYTDVNIIRRVLTESAAQSLPRHTLTTIYTTFTIAIYTHDNKKAVLLQGNKHSMQCVFDYTQMTFQLVIRL